MDQWVMGTTQVVSFPFDPRQSPRSRVRIGVSAPQHLGGALLHHVNFIALWDTGAEMSMVVPKVIATAELKPVAMHPIMGVDGVPRDRRLYPAVIWMPSIGDGTTANQQGATLHPVTVAGLEQDGQLGDIDILIGMDIIGRGDTAITVADGQGVFSYRTPPRGKHIRFEDQGHKPKAPRGTSRDDHPTKKTRRRKQRR